MKCIPISQPLIVCLIYPYNNYNVPVSQSGSALSWTVGFDVSVGSYTAQNANEGSGTYYQVAEQEALVQHQNKHAMLQAYPPVNYIKRALQTKTYDIIAFRYANTSDSVVTGLSAKSFVTINLAVASDLFDSGEDGADLKTVFGVS